MSINPETDLNLEELFQPAWAKGSDSKNQYAKYEPSERRERGDRRTYDRSRREPRGDGRFAGGDRGPRKKGGVRGGPRGDRHGRREPPPPLPAINIALHAENKGAESLARQIKTTGRAYPLFDIASMILQKPDRYCATFSVQKGPEGNVIQPLFVCALDDSLWLSETEAVGHVLQHHLATFYQVDRTATEPPKGTYTFVAQCGMSGFIFGPPNHHDYQTKLRELHARRFSRMPFEVYKSRVKIVRDEAVVKQWLEDQSWKTEYVCLNVPEAARLPDMAAVEEHFRQVHLPVIVRQVESHTLSGPACAKLRGGLWRTLRTVFDQQRRFPMQVATSLSQQFASHGLQFFKVNKTVTHVWVARPTFLDLDNEPVSEQVRRIVQFINQHPKCTRRQLVETLAPTPARPTPPGTPEGETPQGESDAGAATPPTPGESEPTSEQSAIIGDLHWLIHQGHVIEFANGLLETAKKPAPKPKKAPPKAPEKKTDAAPSSAASAPPETPSREPSESPDSKADGESAPASPADTSEPPPVPVPAEPEPKTEPTDDSQPKPQGSAPTQPQETGDTPPQDPPPTDEQPPGPSDAGSGACQEPKPESPRNA